MDDPLTVLRAVDPSFVPAPSLDDRGGELNLTVEQRAAPPVPTSIDERITAVITEANRPLPIGELRSRCRVRNGTLYERLTALTDSGQILRGPEGYSLANRT